MYSNLHAQFFQDVLETFNEYVALRNHPIAISKLDIRKGMDASVSMFHFGEYYADYLQRDFTDVKKELIDICPDYKILESVSNVRKHSKLNRKNQLLKSSEDVAALHVAVVFEDEQGTYVNGEKVIQLSLTDGEKKDLFDVLVNVLNMWYKVLYDNGVLKNIEIYHFDKNRHVSRNEARSVDIEVITGAEYSVTFEFRKFDYEAGKIDKWIGQRVIVFDVTDNFTGEVRKAEFILTNHYFVQMLKLKSLPEREVYVNNLINLKGFKFI